MLEVVNSLSWPAAFAIIASIVTIVTGAFGYLLQSKRTNKLTSNNDVASYVDAHQTADIDLLYKKINDTKDRVSYMDGDIKELRSHVKSLQRQLTDHEHRDIRDFKAIQEKLDKLTDIVIQILQHD